MKNSLTTHDSRLTIFVFLFSVLVFLTSCTQKQNSEKDAVIFTDDIGTQISLSKTPQRIVSLAPNLTEIIFTVGAEKNLVGVTDFCDFPDSAKSKMKIGGIINPNLEAIVSLKPDLVIATADGNPKPTVEKLNSLGIQVFTFNSNNLAQLFDCIKIIGKITDHNRQADSVVFAMISGLSHLQKLNTSKKVFLLLNRNPIISASSGSFLNEILTLSGSENAVPVMRDRYPTLNREEVLKLNPDFIIIPEKAFQPLPENEYSDFESLSTVSAVKNKKIFYLHPDLILRPGPRLVQGIIQLNSILSQ